MTTSDRTFPVSFAPPRRVLENDTIPHETLKAIEDEASEGLSDLGGSEARTAKALKRRLLQTMRFEKLLTT